MTDHHGTSDDDTAGHDSNRVDSLAPSNSASHRHGGHDLMMIACCIPMLVIAVVLVITGVVNGGFLFLALACTAMMALMMRGMPGGGHGEPARQEHPGGSADTRFP